MNLKTKSTNVTKEGRVTRSAGRLSSTSSAREEGRPVVRPCTRSTALHPLYAPSLPHRRIERLFVPRVHGATKGSDQAKVFGLRAVRVVLTRCDGLAQCSLRAARVVLVRCDRQVNQPPVAERVRVGRTIANPPPFPAKVAVPGGGNFHSIRALQLNMRGDNKVSSEVRQMIKAKKLDVLLLQEPYVRRSQQTYVLFGLGTSTKVAATRTERPFAAIAICNPSFQMIHISQLSTTHSVCVEVRAPGFSFYAVSHYFQFRDDIEEHLRHLSTVLRSLRGKRVLISLDANARSSLWGPQQTNRRGEQLERLIREFDLQVINDARQPPTFWTTRGSSYIDVTLTSSSMTQFIGKWTVREGWTTSDHNALDIEMRVPKAAGNDERPRTSRFDANRADWDRFAQILTDLSGTRLEGLPLESSGDVETMAGAVTSVLMDACAESMPRKRLFRRSNPWWTRALTTLKKGVYQQRRAYQRERDQARRLEILREYRTSLRAYSKEVKRTKRASWRNFVTTHGNSETWGFVYKQQANKLRVERVLGALQRGNGFTLDLGETASRLLNAHVPDDRECEDTPQQRETRERARVEPITPDDLPFTQTEVEKAAKTFKNGKAPGPDLVEVVVLKAALFTIPDQFVRLFNACLQHGTFPAAWKEGSLRALLKGDDKDPTDPKSYRPICLLSVVGKLFEKLLRGRIARSAMAPGKISARQYGFVPGKSTEDAISELRRMVDDSQEPYAVGLLFDIAGAFDNVWWPLVLESLRDRGCSRNIFKVLGSYFEDRKVKLTWGETEVSKQATRGCPQGSVLGPDCWNLMFDGLLRVLEELVPDNFVAYADDLLVMIQGRSRRDIEDRAQRVVNRIVDWCTGAKLQLSERKTEAVLLQNNWVRRVPIGRRGGDRPDRVRRAQRMPNMANRYPTIRIGNSRIAFKASVRYLGINFDKCMGVTSHCRYLRDKMESLFAKFGKIAKAGWGLRFGALSSIYRGVFVPTIAYAASSWSDLCNLGDLGILKSAQRRALIAVNSAYRTASYASMCVIAGALPIVHMFAECKARRLIRTGWDANINGEVIQAADGKAVAKIKVEALNMWQAEWEVSTKGRTTFAFFNDVRDRMKASWFRPDHYTTQVLSGHGDFRVRLAALGLVDGESCECGRPDTVEHFLLECENFDAQRVALHDFTGNHGWPEAAHQLVSNAEAFSVFADFCKESLWLKGLDRSAVAAEGEAAT